VTIWCPAMLSVSMGPSMYGGKIDSQKMLKIWIGVY
jgi:hypothetical protein